MFFLLRKFEIIPTDDPNSKTYSYDGNSVNLDSLYVDSVLCKYDSTATISASFSGGFTPYSVILMLGTDTIHTQGGIDSAVTITGLPYGYYDLLIFVSSYK